MKPLIIIIFTLHYIGVFGQDPTPPDIDELVTIPSSPEASAFAKYGKTPVSLFTGTPDISIAIHTIKGREIEMPISLTYDASGIKVEQIATWVGLGWNLNIGGSITRNVHGFPDDYLSATGLYYLPFYSNKIFPTGATSSVKDQYNYYNNNNMAPGSYHASGIAKEYVSFIFDVGIKNIDIQQDTYSFSVNGLSGTIYINYETGKGECIEHPDIDITPIFATEDAITGIKPITGWVIKDKLGNTYSFNQAEETYVYDNGSTPDTRTYNSSWSLTRITSKSYKDVVDFIYNPPFSWVNQQPIGGGDLRRDNLPGIGDCAAIAPQDFPKINAYYIIKQATLNQVKLNGIQVITLVPNTIERKDLKGKYALQSINVFNEEFNVVKQISLNQGYFGDETSSSDFDSRLRLDSVSIYGNNAVANPVPQTYLFEYYGPAPPPRDSRAQDYWGYYNGADDSQELIPANLQFDSASSFQGGIRTPSVLDAVSGTLKSIKYPTGGITEFYYQLPFIPQNVLEVQETQEFSLQLTGAVDLNPDTQENPCFSDTTEPPVYSIGKFTVGIGEEGGFLIKFNVNGGTPSTDSWRLVGFDPDPPQGTPGICDIADAQGLLFKQDVTSFASTEELHYLQGGIYYVAMADNWVGSSLDFRIYSLDTVPVITKVFNGGLRTYKTVDKTDDNNIAGTKYFYYDDISTLPLAQITSALLGSNPVSNGILHQPPMFTGTYDQQIFVGPTPMGNPSSGYYKDCPLFDRFASNRATPTPNIYTHSTVSEIEMDGNGDYNGFTVYNFYNANEGNAINPYRKYELLNGKLQSKLVYKKGLAGHELVLKEESDFVKDWVDGTVGFSLKNTRFWYANRELWSNPQDITEKTFLYREMPILGLETPFPTPCPGDTSAYYIECLQPGPMQEVAQNAYGLNNYWVKQNFSRTTSYRNNLLLTNTTNYFYDDTLHRQVTRSESLDSKADLITTTYKYPEDMGLTGLINDHRIAEVVQASKKVNNQFVSTRRTIYSTVPGKLWPTIIQFGYGDELLLEDKITINSYDNYGNIREYTGVDGVMVTLIWGYNDLLPVAKIVGASFGEVLTELGGTLVLNDELGNAFSAAQHQQLRTGLPNAQITTYTYDPGIGIISQTDPNGLITTYEYGNLNRLYQVKDHDGNVIQQYEYHYAEEN